MAKSTGSTSSDVHRFEPEPEIGWDMMRAEYVHELRWWHLTEIEHAVDVWFAPRRLAGLLRDLLEHGPPRTPIDTGA